MKRTLIFTLFIAALLVTPAGLLAQGDSESTTYGLVPNPMMNLLKRTAGVYADVRCGQDSVVCQTAAPEHMFGISYGVAVLQFAETTEDYNVYYWEWDGVPGELGAVPTYERRIFLVDAVLNTYSICWDGNEIIYLEKTLSTQTNPDGTTITTNHQGPVQEYILDLNAASDILQIGIAPDGRITPMLGERFAEAFEGPYMAITLNTLGMLGSGEYSTLTPEGPLTVSSISSWEAYVDRDVIGIGDMWISRIVIIEIATGQIVLDEMIDGAAD